MHNRDNLHEAAAGASADLLGRLAQQVPCALFVLTMNGAGDLHCDYIGRQVQELFELSPADVSVDCMRMLDRAVPRERARLRHSLNLAAPRRSSDVPRQGRRPQPAEILRARDAWGGDCRLKPSLPRSKRRSVAVRGLDNCGQVPRTTARIAFASSSDENFATYASAPTLRTCSSLVVPDSDE
jgi:hypothetical protein